MSGVNPRSRSSSRTRPSPRLASGTSGGSFETLPATSEILNPNERVGRRGNTGPPSGSSRRSHSLPDRHRGVSWLADVPMPSRDLGSDSTERPGRGCQPDNRHRASGSDGADDRSRAAADAPCSGCSSKGPSSFGNRVPTKPPQHVGQFDGKAENYEKWLARYEPWAQSVGLSD